MMSIFYRYYHNELELKYHNTINGLTFILASARINSINATIGGIGMHFSHHIIKSLNCIEKIQLRMMFATFNDNPCKTIISGYSPTNTIDGIDITTFSNEPFSLDRHISKHNVLIICQCSSPAKSIEPLFTVALQPESRQDASSWPSSSGSAFTLAFPFSNSFQD